MRSTSGLLRSCGTSVTVVHDRRLRHHAGRQRQAVREHVLLEPGVFFPQPRDLVLEYGSVFRHRLTRPADRALATHRNLAGLRIEPQETFRHFAERVSPAVVVRRGIIGQRGSDQTKTGNDGNKGRVGHDFLTGPNEFAATFVDPLRPGRHPPAAILAVIASRCTIEPQQACRKWAISLIVSRC